MEAISGDVKGCYSKYVNECGNGIIILQVNIYMYK